MISNTRESGAAQINMRRELGELKRPNRVLVTPDRPEATPIRFARTGRSPGVMMPWLCAIPHPDTTVPFRTTPGGA